MKLKDIYKICVSEGIRTDLRRKDQINKCLLNKKKEYKDLKSNLKKFFDKESLINPYSDTRILFGNPNKEIKMIPSEYLARYEGYGFKCIYKFEEKSKVTGELIGNYCFIIE